MNPQPFSGVSPVGTRVMFEANRLSTRKPVVCPGIASGPPYLAGECDVA